MKMGTANIKKVSLPSLVTELVVIFGICTCVTLFLFSHLLKLVRENDLKKTPNGVSKVDTLRLKSFPSLSELQASHGIFLHLFEVEFKLSLVCFMCIYLLKQTFAIPGSVILNLFAGAVLPFHIAFPLVCMLTAFGASFCYLLSSFLASEESVRSVCDRFIPKKLDQLLQKVERAKKEQNLFYVLLFLRIFPFSPNWFLNVTSPWLQIPLYLFSPSVFFGLMPYNFITVQAGTMLSSLKSTKDVLDPKTMFSLVVLAAGVLIPAILKKKKSNNKKKTA